MPKVTVYGQTVTPDRMVQFSQALSIQNFVSLSKNEAEESSLQASSSSNEATKRPR